MNHKWDLCGFSVHVYSSYKLGLIPWLKMFLGNLCCTFILNVITNICIQHWKHWTLWHLIQLGIHQHLQSEPNFNWQQNLDSNTEVCSIPKYLYSIGWRNWSWLNRWNQYFNFYFQILCDCFHESRPRLEVR